MNAPDIIELSRLSAEDRAKLFLRSEDDLGPYLDGAQRIIDAIRADGDAALIRFAKNFDGAEIPPGHLRQSVEAFAAARTRVSTELTTALETAIANVRAFHERQKPEPMWLDTVTPGVLAGERTRPIPSVACYAPRGKGAFPSTVVMTATIAKIAGVSRVIVLSPPTPEGGVDDATLVAAELCGVDEVYAVGGAQAVAAAAYGTESLAPCAKIVGPGSLWFMAAKRLLSGVLDVGLPAGPSESLVLALDGADGRMAALDVIIESEHGPDSSAYIVTDSPAIAESAQAALCEFWGQMDAQRAEWSQTVLTGPYGGIVLAPDADAAIAFCNDYAAEHLQILAPDPFDWLDRIEHAGEILLGSHAPSTLANFVLGPSHVLPTNGWAKTASPLSVMDFVKRSSVVHVSKAGYAAAAPAARVIAEYEGFDGHARAIGPARDTLPTSL